MADLRASELPGRVSDRSTLVLPLGAIEQHGPHLPYSTDLIIADCAGAAVVDAVGDELDLWLLPSLAYTKSNEHAWNAGTVWLSATTMLAVLDDIGRSLAMTGVRKLALLNGHGGNTALLNVACRELRLKYGFQTFLLHPFVPPDHGGVSAAGELEMGIHAGVDETSMILHLRPELVDMTLAARNIPEALAENRHVRGDRRPDGGERGSRQVPSRGMRAIAERGVRRDPRIRVRKVTPARRHQEGLLRQADVGGPNRHPPEVAPDGVTDGGDDRWCR